MGYQVNYNGNSYVVPGVYLTDIWWVIVPQNMQNAVSGKHCHEIDHITADFLKVLYKLGLADKFVVSENKTRIWDPDELREVDDVCGYKLWYTE